MKEQFIETFYSSASLRIKYENLNDIKYSFI